VRARLLPILTEMEQQVAPVLVCTHGTVLQILYPYFKVGWTLPECRFRICASSSLRLCHIHT
jgi:broad specificity phosphatase PhoE